MDKALGLLGLAMRAGQLVSGEDTVERLLRAQGAGLVLVDAGASNNTRKKFTDACAYRATPLYIMEEGTLAQAIGRPGRKVVGIKSGELAARLLQLLLPEG